MLVSPNCQDVPVRYNRQDNSDKLLVKQVALRYEFSSLIHATHLSTVRYGELLEMPQMRW